MPSDFGDLYVHVSRRAESNAATVTTGDRKDPPAIFARF